MRSIKRLLLIVAVALAAVACSKNDNDPEIELVTGVSLGKTSLLLNIGKAETLKATIAPENAANKNVTWSSSDAATASVDASGKVTGVKEGTATITVTTEDGGKTASCAVTVSNKAISVGAQNLTMTAGAIISQAYFEVETSGIADGTYTAQVQNLPASIYVVEAESFEITGGKGMLTLASVASTAAVGAHDGLTLKLGDITSSPFTLTISAAGSITVGAQSGALVKGTTGSVSFHVTASGIPDGEYPAVFETLPQGIEGEEDLEDTMEEINSIGGTVENIAGVSMIIISGGEGVMRLLGGATTTAGVYDNLKVNIEGATATFTLTVTGEITGFEGAGTEADPYKIGTAAELKKMAEWVNAGKTAYRENAHYILTADIDLSGMAWTPIGNNNNPYTFKGGSFDGGGHVISGLTISAGGDYCGLFGRVSSSAQIRNLGLINVNIKGATRVGGVVGYLSFSSISSCYVTGTVSGNELVGGMVGVTDGPDIKNCYSTAAVSGDSKVGGIAGRFDNEGAISNCYATGQISGSEYAGGIVGYLGRATDGAYSDVNHCVAVNPRIKSLGPYGTFGRVSGYLVASTEEYKNKMSYNYAYSGMELPATVTLTPSASGIHGSDIGAPLLYGTNSDTWWSIPGTANFSATYWSFAANRLPHLKTTTGGAFSQPQNPTASN